MKAKLICFVTLGNLLVYFVSKNSPKQKVKVQEHIEEHERNKHIADPSPAIFYWSKFFIQADDKIDHQNSEDLIHDL